VTELQPLLNNLLCEHGLLGSLPRRQAQLLFEDMLDHPHCDVAPIVTLISVFPGSLQWELTDITPQSVPHANVNLSLRVRPLL
jgi:hypothetical protein